jgi:hypothetical protein
VLTLLVGASLLGCGLASWRARPDNRVGKIMVFTGFAWFTELLVDATPPWLNTIGLAVQAVWIFGLVYLLIVPIRSNSSPPGPTVSGTYSKSASPT